MLNQTLILTLVKWREKDKANDFHTPDAFIKERNEEKLGDPLG